MAIHINGKLVAGGGGNAIGAAGDGLSKEGDTLSVVHPVKPTTTAEYDALPEADKQSDAVYVITDDNEGGGSYEEIYSTDETRIGTWIDGKPLYRRVFEGRANGSGEYTVLSEEGLEIDTVVHMYGSLDIASAEPRTIGVPGSYTELAFRHDTTAFTFLNRSTEYKNGRIVAVFIYTKTTGPATTQEVTA